MRWLAVVVVAVLALAGCAPVATVPAQPTGEELDDLIARELELQWQYVGLTPGDPRPTVDRIRIVSLDEAEHVHRECMVDAGYENFNVVAGAIYGGATTLERLAIYVCSAQYPVLPSAYGLFSAAQREYLYDHYVTVTVPCLESSGVRVDNVPSRAEFTASKEGVFSLWTPYDELDTQHQRAYLAESKCSYIPEGLTLF
jgi:hypothetical protein